MESDASVINDSRREFFREAGRFFTAQIRKIADKGLLNDEDTESREAPSTIMETRIARLDITKCLAWQNANCQFCYLACPLRERAIVMRDLKPMIDISHCDGCGMCEAACNTVNDLHAIAIVVLKTVCDQAQGGKEVLS